jgi:hypothetical protein
MFVSNSSYVTFMYPVSIIWSIMYQALSCLMYPVLSESMLSLMFALIKARHICSIYWDPLGAYWTLNFHPFLLTSLDNNQSFIYNLHLINKLF